MSINILVTDPNTGFAMMLQQTLEATGRFKVVLARSGAQALSAAKDASFELAIIESELDDFSLSDLVVGLRSRLPDLAIMVIPPFGAKELGDSTILDIQGALPKPFYLPRLEAMVDEALAKPVHGKMRTASPSTVQEEKTITEEPVIAAAPAKVVNETPQPPRAPTVPPPPAPTITPKPAPIPKPMITPIKKSESKLIDADRAAQYLTTLTLESAANAAMLINKTDRSLIASAGHLDQNEVNSLLSNVSDHWAKNESGAQVQIVGEQLLYSTLVTSDVIIAMVFQAQTPLTMIRKQAKRAAEILKSTPKENAGTLSPPNLRRTAHGLYSMAYTFIIVPRLAYNELKGELRDHLNATLRQIASAYDWQVTALDIQPTHVEISLSCPPTDAPDYVIRSIMRDSSDRVLKDFPRIARDHGTHPAIFWAHNYWATSAHKFSPDEIEKFVEMQRNEK